MEWISVDDRLPDDGMIVLIYCPDDSDPVWIGYLDDEQECWMYESGGRCRVSHWMEMPQPPHEMSTES